MTRSERLEEIRKRAEEWRPVPGMECYEVSDLGRVRRLTFRNGQTDVVLAEPRILKGAPREGYRSVKLFYGDKQKQWSVHRLVLTVFAGDAPPGHECAHLDGTRTNNRLENLRWVTRKENHSHKNLHGTAQRGAKNPRARLTEEQAQYVLDSPKTTRELADELDRPYFTLWGLRRGNTWRHLRRAAR